MTLEELFVENYKKLGENLIELQTTILERNAIINSLETEKEHLKANIDKRNKLIREILIIDDGAIKMKETYIWKNYNRKLFDELVNLFNLQEKKEEEE